MNEFMQKVVDRSWWPVLNPLFEDPRFRETLAKLLGERKLGVDFQPDLKDAFKAFQWCTYDDLKVVVLGQDPYPQEGVATGVAFANHLATDHRAISPSLDIIQQELATMPDYDEWNFLMNLDLHEWTKQGVLLINTALTVRVDQPKMHQSHWRWFIKGLLEAIDKPVVCGLLGNMAKEFKGHCQGPVVTAAHPAADTYNNQRLFRGSGFFNTVNQELLALGLTTIDWNGNTRVGVAEGEGSYGSSQEY